MFQAIRAGATQPLALMGAAIFGTSMVLLGYKWGWDPMMKQRKRRQAEEFANYLFEERQKSLLEGNHE